jgi:hypothetical protein
MRFFKALGNSVSHFRVMIITGPFFSDSMRLAIYNRERSRVKTNEWGKFLQENFKLKVYRLISFRKLT